MSYPPPLKEEEADDDNEGEEAEAEEDEGDLTGLLTGLWPERAFIGELGSTLLSPSANSTSWRSFEG